MTRYFFVVLLMGLVGIAIVVKGAMIMFAERQYWHDVADRFVKENVTVKPNRGNILSSDGKLMASSLPEYKIYMDFMSGERDEKRRKKDQQRKDSIWKANFDSICIGLHQIFPDISAATFKSHLRKGREMKSRNYNILPNRNRRISYIQYKEAKRLPVFKMNKYRGGFHEQIYNQRKKPFGSLAARQYRLDNLVAIIDRNHLQISGNTEDVMGIDDIHDRWTAFGWEVKDMNGDDMEDIIRTFRSIDYANRHPHLLVAHTTKGKGVSFMEGVAKWHHGVPSNEQYEQAIQEISERIKDLEYN